MRKRPGNARAGSLEARRHRDLACARLRPTDPSTGTTSVPWGDENPSVRLARRNWGHLPPFGYTKDGPRVTTFGFAPTDPATPPTPIPVRRCCHGVAIDETEASNEHRAECQDAFCSNKGGVPMAVLDQAVITVLLDELLGDSERLWTIIREREAQRVTPACPVVNVTKEIAKLEREIANLVNLAATSETDTSWSLVPRWGRRKSHMITVDLAQESYDLIRRAIVRFIERGAATVY